MVSGGVGMGDFGGGAGGVGFAGGYLPRAGVQQIPPFGRNDKAARVGMTKLAGQASKRDRGNLLSPLRGWLLFNLFIPTACAVGCILSPLRGWGDQDG